MKRKKLAAMMVVCLFLAMMFGTTAFAADAGTGAGNVASAIEQTWTTAASQIKVVVNKVVFPAIDLILAVLFFVKVGTAYMDYRKHGQIEWAPPVILFVCLVFTMTAPLYIWQIVGL